MMHDSIYVTINKGRMSVMVAHTCNPSFSGDRDQEDCGLKPAPGKEFTRRYFKTNLHKKGLVEWLK
jgi:hypothetical protein